MAAKPITPEQRLLLGLARQELGFSNPATANWASLRKKSRDIKFRWFDECPWYRHIPKPMVNAWNQLSDEGKVMVLIVGHACEEDT